MSRHLRYSSRDGHAEGEHVNRGRDTPKFLSYLTGAQQLLSTVFVFVVAQPSSDVPEGLINYLVCIHIYTHTFGATHSVQLTLFLHNLISTVTIYHYIISPCFYPDFYNIFVYRSFARLLQKCKHTGISRRAHTLYVLVLYKFNWPDDGSTKSKHVATCTLTKYMYIIPEVSWATIHEPVTGKLGYRNFCARWVPKMLTDDNKTKRMGSALRYWTIRCTVRTSCPVISTCFFT
jgi:hypothetical protein